MSTLVDLKYVKIVHETDMAWLLRFEYGGDVWLPKSVAELDTGDNVVTVPERWAIDKMIDDNAV